MANFLHKLSTLRRQATELLFPSACAVCDQPWQAEAPPLPLCDDCRQSFQPAVVPAINHCLRCAMPCPAYERAAGECVHCRGLTLQFSAARTIGRYEGPLRSVVLRLKHPEFEPLAHLMGRLLGECIDAEPLTPPPDLATCIPMHWLKRLLRGANAAETICRAVATHWRLPCYPDLLRCQRRLQKQNSLTPNQRWENVRQAYRVSRSFDISGANVLLVDDVLTTGATANDAARALRQAGAASVAVVAIARGTGDG